MTPFLWGKSSENGVHCVASIAVSLCRAVSAVSRCPAVRARRAVRKICAGRCGLNKLQPLSRVEKKSVRVAVISSIQRLGPARLHHLVRSCALAGEGASAASAWGGSRRPCGPQALNLKPWVARVRPLRPSKDGRTLEQTVVPLKAVRGRGGCNQALRLGRAAGN